MRFFYGKNKKEFNFLFCVLGVIGIMKWILPLCWPLIVSLFMIAPIYDMLWKVERRTHIKCGLLTGIFVFMGIGLILLSLVGIGYVAIHICMEQIGEMKEMGAQCARCMENLCHVISSITKMREEDITNWVSERRTESIDWMQKTCLPSLLEKGISSFGILCTGSAVLFITGVLVIMLSKEYPMWRKFFYKQEKVEPVLRMCNKLKRMIGAYVKAEGILFLIISLIVMCTMLLTGNKHPVFWGLLAGLLDFLPLIGTGVVLVPSAILQLLQGNYGSAAIFLFAYGICALVREILEPKLLGKGMKISPVLVLMSVFAGVKIYGVLGVILGPITLIILIQCYYEIYLEC